MCGEMQRAYRGGPKRMTGYFKERIRSAGARDGRADRTGSRALVTECVTDFVWWKKTHGLLSYALRCAAWARDGQPVPAGWTLCSEAVRDAP